MLAVVKMPHIEINIKGNIPTKILSVLKEEYGKKVKLTKEDDNESVNIFETVWFKETKAKITPSDNMKIYRENRGLTQNELGRLLGDIPRQHISNMERGSRAISVKTARKLSEIFNISVEKFI
jgi:DNA-binding XRE family transcriptional regulator